MNMSFHMTPPGLSWFFRGKFIAWWEENSWSRERRFFRFHFKILRANLRRKKKNLKITRSGAVLLLSVVSTKDFCEHTKRFRAWLFLKIKSFTPSLIESLELSASHSQASSQCRVLYLFTPRLARKVSDVKPAFKTLASDPIVGLIVKVETLSKKEKSIFVW